MLHFLVQYADIGTIKMFQRTMLKGWDVDAKNEHMETVFRVLAKRECVSTGLLMEFGKLCELIEETSAVVEDMGNVMILGMPKEDVFENALEQVSAETV